MKNCYESYDSQSTHPQAYLLTSRTVSLHIPKLTYLHVREWALIRNITANTVHNVNRKLRYNPTLYLVTEAIQVHSRLPLVTYYTNLYYHSGAYELPRAEIWHRLYQKFNTSCLHTLHRQTYTYPMTSSRM